MADKRPRPDPHEDPVRPDEERGRVSGTFAREPMARCPRDVHIVVVRKEPPILLGERDVLFPWEVLWLEPEPGQARCLPKTDSPHRHLDIVAAERAAVDVLGISIEPMRFFSDVAYRGGYVTVVQARPTRAIAEPADEDDEDLFSPYAALHWVRWFPSDDERRRMSDDDLDLVALVLEAGVGRGIISACSS